MKEELLYTKDELLRICMVAAQSYRFRVLPRAGLCRSISPEDQDSGGKRILDLFHPTKIDEEQLCTEGKSVTFWASGRGVFDNKKYYTFSPLRQTILLFVIHLYKEKLYEIQTRREATKSPGSPRNASRRQNLKQRKSQLLKRANR